MTATFKNFEDFESLLIFCMLDCPLFFMQHAMDSMLARAGVDDEAKELTGPTQVRTQLTCTELESGEKL